MSDINKAYETQLKNIQAKTGKSLDELGTAVQQSGLTKHSEAREMFMQEFGLGYGDANALVLYLFKSGGDRAAQAKGATIEEVVDEIYTGARAGLRPIHEALMAEIGTFGAFEIAPKKGYLSLRRKKQFAMIGPPTNTRVEVGLNMKGAQASPRLIEMPPGGMCQYIVKVTDAKEVDAELIAWIRQAYESAS